MATVLLRHTDPGAPALNGQDGSLYAVLKWALPQLGWTVAHDAPADFTAAFRNSAPTGTGAYLQVTDKAVLHDSDARMARVQGYLTMAGINAGGGAWMDVTQRFWIKSRDANATARPWTIVGDDQTFYFLPFPDGSNIAILTAGDIQSYAPVDPHRFLINDSSPSSITSIDVWWGVARLAVNTLNTTVGHNRTLIESGMAADVLGSTSGLNVHLCMRTGSIQDNFNTFMGLSGGPAPDAISGSINGSAIEVMESLTARRGRLRGLMNPLHAIAGYPVDGSVVSAGGFFGPADAWLFRYQSTAGGVSTRVGWALISLGDW